MVKKTVVAIKCKNHDRHMEEIQKHPDRQGAPLFIRQDMAQREGWEKSGDGWLCPDCVKRAGNWGLRGDMV